MDIVAVVNTAVDATDLFEVVSDLGTYPDWLDIVSRASVAEPAPDGLDPGPAWSIDLRGQLGPLRRSKRLRMVRTLEDSSRNVRFERREVDGRDHSTWVLRAEIESENDGSGMGEQCALEMNLHYGGALWVPLLDRVLRDEIECSRARLVSYVTARADHREP